MYAILAFPLLLLAAGAAPALEPALNTCRPGGAPGDLAALVALHRAVVGSAPAGPGPAGAADAPGGAAGDRR